MDFLVLLHNEEQPSPGEKRGLLGVKEQQSRLRVGVKRVLQLIESTNFLLASRA